MKIFQNIHGIVTFLVFIGTYISIDASSFLLRRKQAHDQVSHSETGFEDKPYKFFDVLSKEEVKILAAIKVASGQIKNRHYVPTRYPQRIDFEGFLQDVENVDAIKSHVMPIILKIYDKVLEKQRAIFPHLRMNREGFIFVENEHTPTVDGWHIDAPYRECNIPNKVATASHRVIVPILGEGTVFTDHNLDEFLKIYCEDYLNYNLRITQALEDSIPFDSRYYLESGQAAIFDKNLAIHRRPLIKQPRIFMIFDFNKKKWWDFYPW